MLRYIRATDSIVFALLVISSIFVYTGITQGHNGYIGLGVIECILAIVQLYINRTDIIVN